MRNKRYTVVLVALGFVFSLVACGDDDNGDNGDNGGSSSVSQSSFQSSCIDYTEACGLEEEEELGDDFAETYCETSWDQIHHQQGHSDPGACAAAMADVYDCVAAEGCPEDDDEICVSEGMASAMACDYGG